MAIMTQMNSGSFDRGWDTSSTISTHCRRLQAEVNQHDGDAHCGISQYLSNAMHCTWLSIISHKPSHRQDHNLKEGSTLTSLAPRVFATLRTAYGLGRWLGKSSSSSWSWQVVRNIIIWIFTHHIFIRKSFLASVAPDESPYLRFQGWGGVDSSQMIRFTRIYTNCPFCHNSHNIRYDVMVKILYT